MDTKEESKKNIGTEENPIPLSRKLIERSLLTEHLKAIPDADFSRYQKASVADNKSTYVSNLLSARGLSLDEFKIALFLFHTYLVKKNFEPDFVVSTTNEPFISNKIGSRTQCYFGKKSQPKKYKMPFPSLIQMLEKQNVILESEKAILGYLQTLHNLGMITLTEVKSSIYDTTSKNETVKFVHICLNKGFTSAKINLKWGKPLKEDTKVKQNKK